MKTSKTLADRLQTYRVLIYNSRDEEIATLLEDIGVDGPYIDRGDALYTETMNLVEQQKKEYQEQSLAFDKFNEERHEVQHTFDRTMKLVKTMSRNDEDLQDRIHLPNGKSIAIEKWFENTIAFYSSVLHETEFLGKLAQFKGTPERLESEREGVSNLKLLRNDAMKEKGEAQEATRVRNANLDALEDYCIELRALAELALEEKPQLLENLGILVRS